MIMEERTKEEIEWYFSKFTGLIQDMLDSKDALAVHKREKRVRVQKGRVYWKIFVDDFHGWSGNSSRIFGFVRRKDGAIFRPASLKAPETRTKSAIRGYIYDEHPENYFTEYGIVYAEGV